RSRLTRRYFRRWFFWHGKTLALMLEDLFPGLDVATVPVIAGVPRFLYRQSLQQIAAYLRALVREDALARLVHELNTLRLIGLFSERWRRRTGKRRLLPIRRRASVSSLRVAPR